MDLAEIASLLERGGTGSDAYMLRGKVRAATLIRCDELRTETYADPANPTADEQRRKRYAQGANASMDQKRQLDTHGEFERIYRQVIIQNRGNTYAQVVGANDNQIQSAVNIAIDFFVAVYPDPLPGP